MVYWHNRAWGPSTLGWLLVSTRRTPGNRSGQFNRQGQHRRTNRPCSTPSGTSPLQLDPDCPSPLTQATPKASPSSSLPPEMNNPELHFLSTLSNRNHPMKSHLTPILAILLSVLGHSTELHGAAFASTQDGQWENPATLGRGGHSSRWRHRHGLAPDHNRRFPHNRP